MLGAIIGDIVGSIYEFDNIKTKVFPFFDERMEYTDDSILAIATADWLMNGGDSGKYYLKYATDYPFPMGDYGTMFVQWVNRSNRGFMEPYNSCGNGSAMRIGPVGWVVLPALSQKLCMASLQICVKRECCVCPQHCAL